MFENESFHEQNMQAKDVFKKFYPRLCDFANYILKDKDAAEDLVQDVFITFLEQRKNISSNTDAIKSFLYTSVKHSCLNKLRHHKVVDAYNKKFPPEILEDPQILDGIIHAEIMAEIHEAINALPKGCALIIKYGYLEGLKNHKIAEILNISVNTVKSQKQRALNLIRLHLSDSAYLFLLVWFSGE
ncbi:RNA polymerase sigma-70 factor [Pedobacter nyackensis]|uniref:RNA polymerase sigma-70 factor n=1 Tax=Pedobacter nyackensis TaxID=475255 RepID=UPI00292F963D|nr:RNA polymerase sigma-70 factor [Pedobacter nyackensis]